MAINDKIIWTGGMFDHLSMLNNIEVGHLIVNSTNIKIYGSDTDPNGIGWNYLFKVEDCMFVILIYYNPTQSNISGTTFYFPENFKMSWNSGRYIYISSTIGSENIVTKDYISCSKYYLSPAQSVYMAACWKV